MITLPEYTSPNACPDIRVIGSNVCCPLLDEFVTEIPFTGSCNTNTCCEGDVLIDNLVVYSSPIGTDNSVCEEEPFNLCFDVLNNRICDNEACLSANIELIGYTPNGIVSSIILSQGNLIDLGLSLIHI